MTPRGVFVESEVRRLVNELPGLADDYVLGSDDCYLLRPVTPVDLGPLWLQDLSAEYEDLYTRAVARLSLVNTRTLTE